MHTHQKNLSFASYENIGLRIERSFKQLNRYLFSLYIVILCLNAEAQNAFDGERITINSIFVEGNNRTKERYITRELSFEVGESYSKQELDSMFVWNRNRIYNTYLFNTIDFDLTNEKEGSADLKVTVDERWYIYPVPIFKLVDRNFNDWWVNRDRDLSRVNYGMRLTHFNFRGRGEFLRIWLQTGFTNIFALQYRLPYIDKKQRHGLLFDLSYFEAKNVAYTTRETIPRFAFNEDEKLRIVYKNSVRHSYRSSFYSFHFTTLGHYRIDIADTVAQLNENYLGNGITTQQHFWIGHSFVWDKRNNRNYPTEGSYYRVGLYKHGLGIYQDGVDYWRAKINLTKYWEFKNNFYLVVDASILSTLPEERDYFNYYKIGLLKEVLRGYDLNVIEGSSYILQRNEFKHRLFSRKYDISSIMPVKQFQTLPIAFYGKVFYDQGYAKGYPDYDGSSPLTDRYLYSYGAGIDLVMAYDMVFRFELSKNTLGDTHFFINFLSLL